MGSHSRRKGAKFERTVAHALAVTYPDACRGVGQARADSGLADVEGTPWWVECKCGAAPRIHAAMCQAERDRDDRPPVVISRRNGTNGSDPPVDLVTMRLGDWLALIGGE